MAAQPFWAVKTLTQMSESEWEQLCDGCGKCCLHKLEDEDNGDVYYTKVACEYLDLSRCQCSDYANRLTNVSACLKLSPEQLTETYWLPMTCAYRILAEGKPLPDWHPLVSGDPDSVHKANISVRSFAVSEKDHDMDDIEEQIINWII